jgi:hypothetical protein
MQAVTTIGLDIAKSVFQVHGVDVGGQVVIRRQLKRRYLLAFFEKLPPCLPCEACNPSGGIEEPSSKRHVNRSRVHRLPDGPRMRVIAFALALHRHESMSQRRRAECRHSDNVRAEKNDKSDDFNGKAHGAAIITSSAALSMMPVNDGSERDWCIPWPSLKAIQPATASS